MPMRRRPGGRPVRRRAVSFAPGTNRAAALEAAHDAALTTINKRDADLRGREDALDKAEKDYLARSQALAEQVRTVDDRVTRTVNAWGA